MNLKTAINLLKYNEPSKENQKKILQVLNTFQGEVIQVISHRKISYHNLYFKNCSNCDTEKRVYKIESNHIDIFCDFCKKHIGKMDKSQLRYMKLNPLYREYKTEKQKNLFNE